jgi:hypothetical protein
MVCAAYMSKGAVVMNFITNKQEIREYVSDKSNVLIYGMGNYGKRFYDTCEDMGLKVQGFIDNHCKDNYKDVGSIKLEETDADCYVICNRLSYRQMSRDLLDKNVSEDAIFVYMPIDSLLLEIDELKQSLVESNLFVQSITKFTPSPIINFCYLVVHHCNFSCNCCSAFSPFAKEWYADVELFKKDMERMSEIFNGQAQKITLAGGEALLHTQLSELIEISRKNFPKAIVEVLTNGFLLPKMGEEFFSCCRENNVRLIVTKYLSKDYSFLDNMVMNHGFDIELRDRQEMLNLSFDLAGECNPIESFLGCHFVNEPKSLKQGGLLSTCHKATHMDIFNDYFGTDIQMSEADYIDIHKPDVTAEEILEFLAKPIQLCRYCDVSSRYKSFRKWEPSKKALREFINHGE